MAVVLLLQISCGQSGQVKEVSTGSANLMDASQLLVSKVELFDNGLFTLWIWIQNDGIVHSPEWLQAEADKQRLLFDRSQIGDRCFDFRNRLRL